METARRILGEDIEVTIPGKEEGAWKKFKAFWTKH